MVNAAEPAGESFDLRKTFSAQLLTKFGVKLPDLGLVPSFPMATLTIQNKAMFFLDFKDKVFHHPGGELRGKQEQRAFHQAACTLASSMQVC